METNPTLNPNTVQPHPYHLNGKQLALVIGDVVLFVILGIDAYLFIQENLIKGGYYSYGDSCTTDADCVCTEASRTPDLCGKPGQYPACVQGVCGWGYENVQKANATTSEMANDTAAVDTSNWQTYRNEEFGFEVRYPMGWFNTRNLIEDFTEEKLFEFSSAENFTVDALTLQIIRSESIARKNLFTELRNRKPGETFEQDLIRYSKIENLDVGGLLAVRYVADRSAVPYGSLPIQSEVLLQKGEFTYLFIFIGLPESTERQKNVFDQILSTFKFIETENVDTVLFEHRASWGPCPKLDTCFENLTLYNSREVIKEDEYGTKRGSLSTQNITEVQAYIRTKKLLTKQCESSPVTDIWITYQINLDDLSRTIQFPGCRDELENLYLRIDDMVFPKE